MIWMNGRNDMLPVMHTSIIILLSILVAFANQIVDRKMFTNDMQVHHGGAGTTATGLRAGVNAFCR